MLPYLAHTPEALAPADVEWFFETVFTPLRETDGQAFEETIDQLYTQSAKATERAAAASERLFGDADTAQETEAWDAVRFATVFAVAGNPDRIFFETLDADRYRPTALQNAHNRVVGGPPFSSPGLFSTITSHDDALLDPEASLHREILFGSYFVQTTEPTRASRAATETPKAGDIDDSRLQRLRRFLTDERIAPDRLLEGYVHKLVQDQRRMVDEEYHGVAFPHISILKQYAQLRALTEIDALETISTAADTTLLTTHMSTDSTADATPESRDERLEQFIEQHEVIRDSPERQAVFLLGGLVGRLSSYQRSKNISSTLVRRYPIDYLTKQNIKEVTKDVLQMNITYIQSGNNSIQMNSRYIYPLPDLMLDADPDAWTFTQNELQWLYGLGIGYGVADTDAYTADETTTPAE